MEASRAAFAPQAPLPLCAPRISFLSRPLCSRRPPHTARPARPARPARLHASYSADLATATTEIAASATDALIARVRTTLDAAAPVSEDVIQEMVVHLGDSRGMARLGLVDSFGRVGSPAVPSLVTGLRECPNPVVRRSCGKALAKIGDASATEPLIATLLGDDDTVTRASAAGALAKMGRSAIPRLLSVIASADSSMSAKGHASWAIAFMQTDAAASDALFAHARDDNVDVRVAVVSALGGAATGGALPTMVGGEDEAVELAGAGDEAVRERALEAMRVALDDEHPLVQAEAATALANAGVSSQAGRIAALLEGGDVELRRTAALALMKLGDVDALGKLRECAEDEGEDASLRSVARLAVQTIERMAEEEEEDW